MASWHICIVDNCYEQNPLSVASSAHLVNWHNFFNVIIWCMACSLMIGPHLIRSYVPLSHAKSQCIILRYSVQSEISLDSHRNATIASPMCSHRYWFVFSLHTQLSKRIFWEKVRSSWLSDFSSFVVTLPQTELNRAIVFSLHAVWAHFIYWFNQGSLHRHICRTLTNKTIKPRENLPGKQFHPVLLCENWYVNA